MNSEEIKLYNELKKLAKRANQRIVRLEREFGKDSWGIRNLKTRLSLDFVDSWTEKGRVKYNKSMSILQMKATIKAVNDFLRNQETSTKKGIRKKIKEIRQEYDIEDSLDNKEVETLYYDYLEDFSYFADKIGWSEFILLTREVTEKNISFETLKEKVARRLDIENDVDVQMRLYNVYNHLKG